MLNKERPEVIDVLINCFTDNEDVYENKYDSLAKFRDKMNINVCYDKPLTMKIREWLNSEYVEPFKVTQAEKCILELLRKKGYVEIKRDRQGDLWISDNAVLSHVFNNFFRFVKKGERLKIKDILENCEVIEDVD